MDEHVSAEERLRQLLDAVRPQTDDLEHEDFADVARRIESDPHWRAAYRNSQRLDTLIGEGLAELPIPAGAVERLLVALARVNDPAEAASLAVPTESASTETGAQQSASQQVSPPATHASVRPWAAPLALAGTLALALVAYVVLRPAGSEWGWDDVLSSDEVLLAEQRLGEPTPIERKSPPPRYPASDALAMKPIGWHQLSHFLGRTQGVAYQLRAGAVRATLYVIDFDAPPGAPQFVDLPTAPAITPKTTQDRALSVWRSGKLVYLLSVVGGEAQYRAFVTPAGQLAMSAGSGARAGIFVAAR